MNQKPHTQPTHLLTPKLHEKARLCGLFHVILAKNKCKMVIPMLVLNLAVLFVTSLGYRWSSRKPANPLLSQSKEHFFGLRSVNGEDLPLPMSPSDLVKRFYANSKTVSVGGEYASVGLDILEKAEIPSGKVEAWRLVRYFERKL